MPGKITSECQGSVVTLSFKNPPMNFLSHDLLEELYHELLRVRGDRSVRALILTGGVPGSFVTHYDLQESLELSRRTPRRSRRGHTARARLTCWLLRQAHRKPWLDRLIIRSLSRKSPAERGAYFWVRCLDLLDSLPQPVIAAINGLCLGGGCELSLCADFRLMARGAAHRIGLPEVVVGLLPGGAGTLCRLPGIVGEANALEMLLTGKAYTPEEARALGLLHAVVEPDRLLPAAWELAARLARNAPLALALIRDAVRRANRLGHRQGRIADLAAIWAVMASGDARAGIGWYAGNVLAHNRPGDFDTLVERIDEISARAGVDVPFKGT